ncbi:MAG TPA: hypothetical protein VN966_01930 [Candidatus Bathyarchaeia archaeon]|nr:hypothetical protein [Candidatus Bathyarchaeia archaeon]
MRTQNELTKRRNKWQLILPLLLVVLCGPGLADARPPAKISSDFYRFGQEFLRALYPELSGKRYVVSIESAVPYDDPASLAYWFRLSVGEGPKFLIKKCCFGGYLNNGVIGLPQPPPPPGLPPSPPAPSVAKKPLPWLQDVDEQGAIHFKQYLTTNFTFDKRGRLKDFGAEGPAINDGEADKKIFEIVTAHPEFTDAQVVATLKENGTQYGPNDKEEFTKNLPLQKLEPFLGKLKVDSLTFNPLDEHRTGISSWPDWLVEVSAKQKDGSVLRYQMFFDHRQGKLFGLYVISPTPNKP